MINWGLLNYAEYDSHAVIQQLFKAKYPLGRLAEHGDSVAQSICIDLENAYQSAGLSDKQKEYITMLVVGYTQNEIGIMCERKQQSVSKAIIRGCKKVSNFLEKRLY